MMTTSSIANQPTKKMADLLNQENITNNIASKDIKDIKPKAITTRQFGKEITNIHNDTAIFKRNKDLIKRKCLIEFNKRWSKEVINLELRSKADENVKGDPQYLYDYAEEIYDYLKEIEAVNVPNYFNIEVLQSNFSQNSRRIVIKWLFLVQKELFLLSETLYLAINLMDRYLSIVALPLTNLPLLAIASCFISSKFEEIYPPYLEDFVAVAKDVDKYSLLKMEGEILDTFDYDILTVSPLPFLERYHFLNESNEEVLHLAKLLVELTLISLQCINYPSSLKASTALYIALKILKMDSNQGSISNIWTNSLRLYTGYKVEDMKGCRDDLYKLIRSKFRESEVIFEKYEAKEYLNVSRFFKNYY